MKNHGVSNGLFMGLVLIVYTLALYLINPELMFKMGLGMLVSILVYVVFMVRAGNATKADLGGYMSFKQALKPTFLVFVVGTLLYQIFYYVLFNFIDPSLMDVLLDNTIRITEWWLDLFNAPADAREAAIAQVEEKGVSMGIGQIVQQYLMSLIFGFIIALIVSAIIKKKAPEEAI